ncbi:MAG: hypothetical protein ABSF14_09845, partial [Terriglobia bacterium]
KIKTPVNRLCTGHQQGLDDETKNFDSPVEGEVFLLTSPFIERSMDRPLGVAAGRWALPV